MVTRQVPHRPPARQRLVTSGSVAAPEAIAASITLLLTLSQ